jgi:lipoprotein NlpI
MKKIAIAALLLCVPISALASSYDELNAAIQLRNREEWDKALPFLDKALAAGDLTINQKFAALLDRAETQTHLGHPDLAVSDFTAALALQPGAPYALWGRAALYEFEKKYDLAVADLDGLIEARPLLMPAYTARARVEVLRGQIGKGRDDLRTLLSLLPDSAQGRPIGVIDWQAGLMPEARRNMSYALDHTKDLYSWVWLTLVDLRTGKEVPRRDLPEYDKAKWPAPIAGFFLGEVPQQDVFDMAAKPAGGGDGGVPGQTCEANFYVGGWLLQHHDTAGAAPLIRKAAADCPPNFVEWMPAQMALEDLP